MRNGDSVGAEVLSKADWAFRVEEHFEKVHIFAQSARDRAARREKHPVYDFLTKYYPFSLGKFEKWQPGIGFILEDGDISRFKADPYHYDEDGRCWIDSRYMSEKEAARHQFTKALLENTQQRKAVYSCFGLHEWAMVYSGADIRHKESAPLRLPQAEIDELVKSRPLVCTHFDAFRFFSPEAKPMNKHQLNLDDRPKLEQPACIHANMDLYKWAYKSMPWVGSETVWKCFQLALKARTIDMKASPYDLREWGYEPIYIETEKGRAKYQSEQRELESKGRELRQELLMAIATALP